MSRKSPLEARYRRHRRVRGKVSGTPDRPRLSVFRSLNHIYAQVIDDTQGRTLAAASTVEKEFRDRADGVSKTEAARLVGASLSQRARGKKISRVTFDRGGYKYHGRVKALAEGARQAGLDF